jgi:glycosyltransferase involved in cell wall biosynthesis
LKSGRPRKEALASAAMNSTVESEARVLHITSLASRFAGGLYETVPGLAKALSQLPGYRVMVLAVRDARFERDRSRWSCPIAAVPCSHLGPRKFLFAPGMLRAALAFDASLVLCHGIWNYHALATLLWAQRTGRPYIVSPHGMLDHVDLAKSRWVKTVARKLYVDRMLRGAACLRALSRSEADSIRAFGLKNPVCLVPNGVDLPAATSTESPPWAGIIPKPRRVLFYLGRINPKKGLTELVKGLALVVAAEPVAAATWDLVIAGWDQDGYEGELKRLVTSLALSEKVHFLGPVFAGAKQAAFSQANAFILPSKSEGLPTVVLEAWAYRLPVVITAACNIPEAFSRQAALQIDVHPAGIADGLRQLLRMSDQERELMGERGRELVREKFIWPKVAQQMRAVLGWLLHGQPRPPFVTA